MHVEQYAEMKADMLLWLIDFIALPESCCPGIFGRFLDCPKHVESFFLLFSLWQQAFALQPTLVLGRIPHCSPWPVLTAVLLSSMLKTRGHAEQMGTLDVLSR